MHIVLSFVSSGGPHPTIWYRMFAVLAGLCFLHPTPTILHGQTIQIWSIHWQVLVRTSGLGVQNSRGQRWRYADGMHLCSDGNFMGLLPARSQAMVAKYSSDWIQVDSKMLYLPKPSQYVWIVPITNILGRLPLVPAGQTGTIPYSMHARQQACFEYGECDKADEPGTGSLIFHINSWAMVFPSDHPVVQQ